MLHSILVALTLIAVSRRVVHAWASSMKGVFAGAGSEGLQQRPIAETIIELTGKSAEAVTVLYVGTATYDLSGPRENQTKILKELGCKIDDLVCSPNMTLDEIESKVANADVVLVSGGNTLYAMDMWKMTGFADTIKRANEGKVLCGGSAGAICWFDAGHSDSADPDSFKEAMIAEAMGGSEKKDESTSLEAGQQAKDWAYLRVSCLSMLPGLVCPHADKVQSNGILRAIDFDSMLVRHKGERGIAIDHFAALIVDGEQFRVLSLEDRPGSVLPDGTHSAEREGKPGIWIKEVQEGSSIKTTLVPPQGSLSDIFREASMIIEDGSCETIRTANPVLRE